MNRFILKNTFKNINILFSINIFIKIRCQKVIL